MASVATDARLRIAVGLIVIALAIASLLMVWRPETETWFRNVQTLMCGVLLVWGATILVGKTEAGRLVLTRRRWRYFTLLGVVMGVASLFVVTSVIMARPGGNAVWPLFPSVISLFVAQLYEPESGAQFRASDLTDRDARLWKRIALLSTVIGAILVCIAAIAGAVGNIGVLAFLLPIGVLFLVFAAALWTMLRLRDRQLRAKP